MKIGIIQDLELVHCTKAAAKAQNKFSLVEQITRVVGSSCRGLSTGGPAEEDRLGRPAVGEA